RRRPPARVCVRNWEAEAQRPGGACARCVVGGLTRGRVAYLAGQTPGRARSSLRRRGPDVSVTIRPAPASGPGVSVRWTPAETPACRPKRKRGPHGDEALRGCAALRDDDLSGR